MGKKSSDNTKVAKSTSTAKTVGKAAPKARKVATPPAELKFKYSRLPRAPLLRLIKSMAHEVDPEARVQSQMVDRMEQVIQQLMADYIASSVLAARKEKRKTMMAKDLDFVMEIKGDKFSATNVNVQAAPAAIAPAAPATVAASSN